MNMNHAKRSMRISLASLFAMAVLAACGTPVDPGGPVTSVDSVTIDGPEELDLFVGQNVELMAEVEVTGDADQSVTWSSGDETVATVDADGTLTAVDVGGTTITATSVGDPSVSDSVTVNVAALPDEPGVFIAEGDSISILEGATASLNVTVVGDGLSQDVTFESEDETVATVDAAGEITAVAEGDTVVTVTSVDDPTLSATIAVEVTAAVDAPAEAVESVTITGGTVNLPQVGDTTQLEVDVVATGGADESVTWTSEDETIVTVSETGLVTAVGEGSTQVTATSVFDTSVSDSVTVVVGDVDPLVVTNGEDYDPYYLMEREPDAPVPGSLRAVLEGAPAGSTITFADGIDEIVVWGVDVYDPNNADAHLVFRNDVTLSDPEGVTLTFVTAYQTDDPGDPFTYHSRGAYVPAGVDVTLEGITITGGSFIYDGGGIRNDGTLTMRDSAVTGNRAWQRGGGIFNAGDLTLENTLISNNVAATLDTEVGVTYEFRGNPDFSTTLTDGGYGGGIYNGVGGTVTITGSEIVGNEAKASGAGIYDEGASLTVANTVIDGNVASEVVADTDGDDTNDTTFANYGGGLYTEGTFVATDLTFSNNVTTENGGGMYLSAEGDATLNATVAFEGNDAAFGGGLFHQYTETPDNLTPADPVADPAVTFTGNTAVAAADADYYTQDTAAASLMSPAAVQDQGPGRFVLPPEQDTPDRRR